MKIQKARVTCGQLPSVRGHFDCVYVRVLDKGTLGYPAGVPVIVGYLPYSPQQVWVNFVALLHLTKGCRHRENIHRVLYESVKSNSVKFWGVLVTVGARMSSPTSWKRCIETGTIL